MPAFFNTDVQIKVEVGFDSTGPTSTSFTWTDISKYVRRISAGTGRSFELDAVTPSFATFVLSDQDRRFDPDSTGGAYAPNVDVRKPVRWQTIHGGTTFDEYYGFTDSWRLSGDFDRVVRMSAVDGLSMFGNWETATTGPEEAAHVRIGRFLDAVSWPASLRALDTDGSTMAAYGPACASVLGEINRVTKTDDGVFFMDNVGNATYHSHSHRTGSTSIVTLSDTGGALHYTEPLVKDYNTKQIWNDITVAGVAVASQATDSTGSVDKYGRNKLKLFDTLHATSTAAVDTATDLRDRYKDPQTRIPVVTLEGQSDTGLWPHVLGRGLSDRVQIRQATKSATTGVYDADHHIEGVNQTVSVGGKWVTKWLLSPAT